MKDWRIDSFEVEGVKLHVLCGPTEKSTQRANMDELTPGQRAVAELAVQGLSDSEIAQLRNTSKRTVANQLRAVYEKLKLANRLELTLMWTSGIEPPQ